LTATFQINTIIFDIESLTAQCEESAVSIEMDAKSISLLHLLASAGEKGCSRNEILNHIWHDKVVSDDSLTNLVSQTRNKLKVLNAELIKTVPKKGYVINGVVMVGDDVRCEQVGNIFTNDKQTSLSTTTEKNQITARATKITKTKILLLLIGFFILGAAYFIYDNGQSRSRRTLAILPIQAFAAEQTLTISAASFTEELTHQFANYPGISIISRTEATRVAHSGLSIQAMSDKLHARYLIEGSVRQTDNKVRVTIQLIDGSTGLQVFSRVIEASHEKFIKQQEVIIQSISRLVVAEIPAGLVNDKRRFDPETLQKKCESYLDLAKLYADFILDNISSIASSAETACISYAQVKFGNAKAQTKIAALYHEMALASKTNRSQMLSFVELGHRYLRQAAESNTNEVAIFETRAKMNLIEIEDSLNNGLDNKQLLDSAIHNLQDGLDLYPQNISLLNSKGEIYRNLGVTYRRRGKSSDKEFAVAERAYSQVIEINSNNEVVWAKLSRLQMSMAASLNDAGQSPIEKLRESIESIQIAIELNPKKPSYLTAQASSLMVLAGLLADNAEPYQASFDQAKNNLHKAFEISNKLYKVQSNLADLYRRIARIKLAAGEDVTALIEKGIVHGNKALNINPDYVWTYFALMELNRIGLGMDYAKGHSRSQYFRQCLAMGDKGIEIKGDSARAWISWIDCQQIQVRIYLEEGELKAARQALNNLQDKINELMKMDANYSYSYQIAGINQLLQARSDGKANFSLAIFNLEKAVSLNPQQEQRKIALLEAYLYQFSDTNRRPSKLSAKIEQLIKSLSTSKPALAEFKLQHLIYQKLKGAKIDFRLVVSQLEKENRLSAKASIRKYSEFTKPNH